MAMVTVGFVMKPERTAPSASEEVRSRATSGLGGTVVESGTVDSGSCVVHVADEVPKWGLLMVSEGHVQ
jgi:hypothetical protein